MAGLVPPVNLGVNNGVNFQSIGIIVGADKKQELVGKNGLQSRDDVGLSESSDVKFLEKELQRLTKIVNSFTPTELKFEIHQDSQELMVKVINAETKEVIREIPPHQVLEIVAEIKKLLGILVDTKI
ncbi:flagellar protein FlaG [Carboxydothermus ferrireducens]|uniref:Flagellar protein FlaG n=1 Tax=Carboxydothermus ferrireducens DSM 11255 TaxID=1119529 RepID=A0ABX2RAU2_9THEO|nr:flagellar protein FlaG [Carboxydothermus ferrireducens]NYE56888.1 flagellar protein FlaG [Carboxydothermus ferrireducens DSM 11255]